MKKHQPVLILLRIFKDTVVQAETKPGKHKKQRNFLKVVSGVAMASLVFANKMDAIMVPLVRPHLSSFKPSPSYSLSFPRVRSIRVSAKSNTDSTNLEYMGTYGPWKIEQSDIIEVI